MQQPPTLNRRRQHILEIIVGDYIVTALPVASQQIALRHDLQVSSATIRNDMAELEEMGYITRPHASAGGIPGDMAYRFYVERTPAHARPSRQFEQSVIGAIQPGSADPDAWAQAAVEVLSSSLHNVAVATSPKVWEARVKQLQLVHLQERQALLVLVLHDAHVRQHMVQTSQPLSQEALTALSNRLNSLLAGRTANEIRTAWDSGVVAGPAADAVIAELLALLDKEEQNQPGRQYTEGLRHMLSQPEFENGRRAREAVEVLEDGVALRRVITDVAEEEELDVIIGEENPHEPLKPYSVVLARYGRPGHVLGVVGTVGPTRMDYARAIASVRYLAAFLSDLVTALEDNG